MLLGAGVLFEKERRSMKWYDSPITGVAAYILYVFSVAALVKYIFS
jgi:hypothetical protein